MTARALPPLNPWLARSTYALILTIAVPVCALLGFDPLAMLGVDDVTEGAGRLAELAMLATSVWMYAERRSPRHSIDWKGSGTAPVRAVVTAAGRLIK